MIEREVRFKINDEVKNNIINSSNLVENENNCVDLCMGKYGFDSLDKLGYIIRIRNKSGHIFMECKRRLDDTSWNEAQIELKSMNEGYDFLSNLGLTPYLYISRKREQREIEQARVFIDKVDLLGTFVEFELKDGFSFRDLIEYCKRNGINGKPQKLYGDIFKEKMEEPEFKIRFERMLKNFLNNSPEKDGEEYMQ